MRTTHPWVPWLSIACMGTAAAAVPPIAPVPGLVLTTNVHSVVVANLRSFGYVDQENLVSLVAVDPEALTYRLQLSAPANRLAENELRKYQIVRKVRRQDLVDSSRMTLLYSGRDPEYYGGQTFMETSRKVLEALKTGGGVPFVLGPYDGMPAAFEALSKPPKTAASNAKTGIPVMPNLASLMSQLFSSARHYYRGTLHRVEAHDVAFPVLVNGVREDLPAVHAAGTFRFPGEDPAPVQLWFLDNPQYPLNLEWIFGPASSLIVRIDLPVGNGNGNGNGGGGGGGGGGAAGLGRQLASRQCRVELHGIYFNSGSAVLLEESEPMLRQIAAMIEASPAKQLTVEGHTDNIGSAAYNLDLSTRRAEAVRTALITRYGVTASRLAAKGFGFTRPVDTNATYVGRAHNRRVEISRDCSHGR